jgi:hypothetical protein
VSLGGAVDEKLHFCHKVVTDMSHLGRYGRDVDEKEAGDVVEGDQATVLAGAGNGGDQASRVARRLERIEALDRERAPAGQLLDELRELVHEAEAWARAGAGARSGDRLGNPGAGGSTVAAGEEVSAVPTPEPKVHGEVEGMR